MGLTWRQNETWLHIYQDEEANTIVMWVDVEPRLAARATVGQAVHGLTDRGVEFNYIVAQIDQPAGRLYVVPAH